MRLQLCIQRQGLPPVRVLWNAEGLRPSQGTQGTTTISQFLHQVNEVIPLEAEDWGLEDYCVDVNGYECLHFAVLDQILKEDDQISIRPLQTTDFRYRRISGRHQISADGKHLIDGVAFGRPFLRRADRPAIRLPPRKRLRFTIDDEDEKDLGQITIYNQRELAVAEYNNEDELARDGGDEEDYEVVDKDTEMLTEELKDLEHDLHETERSLDMDGAYKSPGRITRSHKRRRVQGLGLHGEGIFEDGNGDGNEEPSLKGYHNPLLDQYYQDDPVIPPSERTKRPYANQDLPSALSTLRGKSTTGKQDSRRSSSVSTRSVHFVGDVLETPITIREMDDSDESDDEDFRPDEEMSEQVESDKENVEPGPVERRNEELVEPQPALASSDSSSEEFNLSSEESSDSESETSETSSSYTTSSGSSSSEDEVISDKQAHQTKASVDSTYKVSTIGNSSARNGGSAFSTPPHQGLRKTQKRNERRRINKRMIYLKSKGILPPDALIADYNKLKESEEATGVKASSGGIREPDIEDPDIAAAFERKRKSLLESIASGGVEVTRAENTKQDIAEIRDVEGPIAAGQSSVKTLQTPTGAPHSRSTSVPAVVVQEADKTPEAIVGSEKQTASSEPPRRRSKLDLASSKRLLFGSLGLRTPKNKEEEDKLREKLMGNVKPITPNRDRVECGLSEENADKSAAEDDSWRKNIVLRAVECCHDGIKLSTPPFPFVQRWDPQQRGQSFPYGNGQKESRSKKRKRNNKKFLQQEEEQDQSYYTLDGEADDALYTANAAGDDAELNTATEARRIDSDECQGAVDKQLLQDTTGSSMDARIPADELPTLPENVSALAALVPEAAKPGTIIAFKQLDMSQETNWQPQISGYRTAKIDKVLDNGQLEMTLAYRDRPYKEKLYDGETGERLYSKFEMPDFDAEDENGDDGFLELGITEMIEPKLIQPAIPASTVDNMAVADSVEQPAASENLTGIETVDMSAAFEGDDGEDSGDIILGHDRSAEVIMAEEVTSFETMKDSPQHLQERVEITEESRVEISMLIKDAGFRSNVHSDIEQALEESPTRGVHDVELSQVHEAENSISPRFNGFNSPRSGHLNHGNKEGDLESNDSDEQLPSSQPETNGANSKEVPYTQPNNQSPQADSAIEPEIEDSWHASGSEDEGGDHSFRDDSFPIPAEPPDDPEEDPDFELKSSKASSRNREQRRSTRYSTRGGSLDAKPNGASTVPSGANKSDSDSDSEFPTVEAVFSTARSQVRSKDTDNDDRNDKENDFGKARKPVTRSSLPSSRLRSGTDILSLAFGRDPLGSSPQLSANESDGYGDISRSHGGSKNSQIVDLTQDSDGIERGGSEELGNGLPTGPGWVSKRRLGRRRVTRRAEY